MTDKNLKQDDCTLAVKAGSRGHTSATLHQIPQQNASVIAPHGGFAPLPADVAVHHPHHLPYRMLQPSFQSYHPLSLPASLPGSKPGQISNDLGPPIFMPPLNLGIPKSSAATSSSVAPVPSNKPSVPSPQIPSSSTSLSAPVPAHLDNTSSPNVMNSYPSLITPSAATPYHTSAVLHPSQQPPYVGQTLSVAAASKSPSVLKGSKDQETQAKPSSIHPQNNALKNSKHPATSASAIGFVSNNLVGQNASLSMGPGRGTSPVNMVKHSGIMKSGGSVPNLVELPPGYITTSHYQQQHGGSKSYPKPPKDISNSSESIRNKSGELAAISGGLGSGNVLVCMEGLPPPVPRNVSSSSSGQPDRSHSSNHISELHYSNSPLQVIAAVSDSQIPWPEAISKNIIIPAPNLTGKDIANLTSATSSPIATNDRTGNDISWLPLATAPPTSDHHQQQQFDNHHSSLPSSTSSSSLDSLNTTNSSFANVASQDSSGYSLAGSNSAGMGIGIISQNATASPRPSILRKRTYDGRPAEVTNSPSSPGVHKLLRQRSRGSPCEQQQQQQSNENHCVKDDVLSPRKRPRKQQLYIDSSTDHFPVHQAMQEGVDSLLAADAGSSIRNSMAMVANERLLGPLPLKEKKPGLANMEEALVQQKQHDKSSSSSSEIVYMSQLRKSPYPMIQLCRRTHRMARNHFRRHADIKHREEETIPPQEVCSQSSTWLRSSGWKLKHFNSQLERMESYESDVLSVMDRLKETLENVLSTMSEEELEEKHRKFLRETMMGNIERIKRSRLHTQETRETMMKILDVNGKVVEIMKKFAGHLPTKLLTTSTSILDNEDDPT